ncbi:hypothetical protein [Lactobacillus sp. ESL0677]|uniref:hypothetical protein n=1 Tax=Lactobacillus sp. ESL0677 TaxID=2983208 RepID=UPI0023F66407|nr:hypothetical protein [Lactobacillus sp. ESL0677]WEV37712.1 hypothetical protein OZX76_03935 [Lactobacillus sp. ESL0677]
MTEEKRIFSRNGVCLYFKKEYPYFGPSEKPEPISYRTLDNIVSDQLDDDFKYYIEAMGGVDWLWKQFKPVPEKKWYVKVPHTYPSSWYQIGQSTNSTFIVTNLECRDNDSFKFTDEEIKYYGLQDCEKVPADD